MGPSLSHSHKVGTAAVDRPLYTNHPRKTADSPTGLEIPAHNRFETYMQFMYFM